ncbi:glycoprotein-N-acetylgalactosamine 3-beta-galactosyltransferase 1-B-like [Haliotis rubra]|uniref:glycoprotein-N-acetylgalactosamine 3-beta-galactosyltransferase 1-B-like n=1 Tax=Haliotis rubra TaxID=36100 RepID=UPI001EE4FD36|nr:glycoprotein-N-acetylgalactosamine 3-beta-galactosyltransferase 1-B-like [Haliotis rubra]
MPLAIIKKNIRKLILGFVVICASLPLLRMNYMSTEHHFAKWKIQRSFVHGARDNEDYEDNVNASRVRISCWVMTSPQNLEKRSRYIQMTWGKRCDKLVFISSETNTTFPAVGQNVSEGRNHLTEKTLGGYHYVYENHFDDCDWFFKADDDTYLIAENLRLFLADFDTNKPIYFGHHFKAIIKQGYSSGGSGLVVSKEALRRFGLQGHDPKICRQTGTAGDAAFGQCMQSLGIPIGNSTDSKGRSRFHCLSPATHIDGIYPKWFLDYDANGAKKGISSMSDYPISFHYVAGSKMLELEYLIYHTRSKLSRQKKAQSEFIQTSEVNGISVDAVCNEKHQISMNACDWHEPCTAIKDANFVAVRANHSV